MSAPNQPLRRAWGRAGRPGWWSIDAFGAMWLDTATYDPDGPDLLHATDAAACAPAEHRRVRQLAHWLRRAAGGRGPG